MKVSTAPTITPGSELRLDPGREYKRRVKAISATLPRNYREIVFANYKEYDTNEGRLLLTRVVFGNSADIKLTEILERIASGELKLTIHG